MGCLSRPEPLYTGWIVTSAAVPIGPPLLSVDTVWQLTVLTSPGRINWGLVLRSRPQLGKTRLTFTRISAISGAS
jgi:hypothetical protein